MIASVSIAARGSRRGTSTTRVSAGASSGGGAEGEAAGDLHQFHRAVGALRGERGQHGAGIDAGRQRLLQPLRRRPAGRWRRPAPPPAAAHGRRCAGSGSRTRARANGAGGLRQLVHRAISLPARRRGGGSGWGRSSFLPQLDRAAAGGLQRGDQRAGQRRALLHRVGQAVRQEAFSMAQSGSAPTSRPSRASASCTVQSLRCFGA